MIRRFSLEWFAGEPGSPDGAYSSSSFSVLKSFAR